MAGRARVITADEAAALIDDGATVTVSSSSGLACPDAVLAAIGRRFRACGHPQGITSIHPIAAGDMHGIKGIDHLAQRGLLATVVAGSYPSGPSSMPSPEIWRMIGADEVAAYNVPSGILFDMHHEVAAKRPGVLTQVGIDTFVDPRRNGCKMNAAAREDIVRLVEFDGAQWLHFRNFVPDAAIIRATTADEWGNLSMEHEGAYLGVVDQALAARNSGGFVIAQVKRLTAGGEHPDAARARALDAGRLHRRRSRPVADHAHRVRPGDQRRDAQEPRRLSAARLERRSGHRAPRGAGARRRRRRQPRLRHRRDGARACCWRRAAATR